jgi:hypothetical protein
MIFKPSFLPIGVLLSSLCKVEALVEICFDSASERNFAGIKLPKAIARTESNFNPKAVHQVNAWRSARAVKGCCPDLQFLYTNKVQQKNRGGGLINASLI